MGFLNRLKEKLESSNSKKLINNLAAVVIACVIVLISLSVFFPKEDSKTSEDETAKEVLQEKNIPEAAYNDNMEERLENILSKIEGVGEVQAMITYETSTEVIPASNTTKSEQTTEESDKQGGTRIIKQENISQNIVTVNGENYNNSPIVIKEVKPVIRGVIVVAEGAGELTVKNQVIEAVTTIFQIKSHKVKVYGKN